jgi:hypothetical protein
MRGLKSATLAWWLALSALAPAESAATGLLDEHSELRFIAQRLPAGMTLEESADSPAPGQIATDRALGETLSLVLGEFFAPPATFAGKARGVIAEVCRHRPAQAPLWTAIATHAILAARPEDAEQELVAAITAAVAANPAAASASVRQALHRIVLSTQSRRRDAAPLDLITAGRFAGSVVRAAATGVRTQPDAGPLIAGIASEALREAREQRANYLLVESLAAAIEGGDKIQGALVGDLAHLAFVRFARNKETAGLIAAACLKGAGPGAAPVVKDQAAFNLPVQLASFVTIVSNACVVTHEATDEPGALISRSIVVANADFIPALMIGAVVAKPQAAVEILQSGLNRDLVLHGRATAREIVAGAALACEARAPELAAAAVGRGDLLEGNAPALIAEGIALAVPASQLGEALAAQLRAQPPGNAGIVRASVAGAIAGLVTRSQPEAISSLTFAATAQSQAGAAILEQVFLSAPPESLYAGVLGVLAADPSHAPALLQRALLQSGVAPAQLRAIAVGGGLVVGIQRDPLAGFGTARRLLEDAANATPETSSAILLATALVNPRGAHIVAAAAVAAGFDSRAILAAVSQGNGEAPEGVAAAVETARQLTADPAAAPRALAELIRVHPEAVPEIVSGAVAARPDLAAPLGRIAAEAAPALAGTITARLFAISAAGSPGADDEAAALTASVIHGLTAADLDPSAEPAAVSATVAAAVRSVLALSTSQLAGGATPVTTITAVIRAAAGAAPMHTLDIARTAARCIRSLAGPSARLDPIRSAILAGVGGGDEVRVGDAIAGGFHEAEMQVPAPNVRLLSDYAQDTLTGPPMTHYLDL